MTMLPSAFTNLLDISEVIDDVIFQKYNEYKGVYEQYLNVGSIDKASASSLEVAAFGAAPQIPVGNSLYIDEAIQGSDKQYPVLDYAMGFRLHQNLIDDDKKDVVNRFASTLPRSFNSTVAQLGANLLNNGFTVANGIDGKYLFATDHPLIGGGTYSNYSTASLSTTAIWAAINSMRMTTDDRGLLIDIEPENLIVSPSLEKLASQLMGTTRGEPGTANNDMNSLQGQLKVIVDRRLTDSNAWFITAAKNDHSLRMKWRKKFYTGVHQEPLSFSVVNYGRMRLVVYQDGWRGTYGSIGTVA